MRREELTMIRETEYRKQALARWQHENDQTKEELKLWVVQQQLRIRTIRKKMADWISHKPYPKATDK
jgi:hypothetical protein